VESTRKKGDAEPTGAPARPCRVGDEARRDPVDDKRLSLIEKAALKVGELMNGSRLSKRIQWAYLSTLQWGWMRAASKRLTVTDGFEAATRLRPDRGVLLVANHRSFFDLYFVSVLLIHEVPWFREIYFPVRSNFFYTSAAGIAVNMFISAGAMYPPVFRESERRKLNARVVGEMTERLQRPGTVVGMHPEGTRKKDDDPYTLLPGKAGTGELIARARPLVLPVFINGLDNGLAAHVKRNFTPNVRQTAPTIAVFGEPLDHLADAHPELEGVERYKRISQDVLDAIARLGERERELRASLATQ
jgi:1-acyl-sn-glycerol-3-phosphate acyltransferase